MNNNDFEEVGLGEGLKMGTLSVMKAGVEVGRSTFGVTAQDDAVVVYEETRLPETESTTEPIRNLASIRKIAAIEPIEGADRIVCATVDGWKLVTQKSNDFKPNDLVVYFEIDSFLPVREEFEFLRPACFKSTKHLGDGFRIKTIKLKGQVSQGLILPLDTFFDKIDGVYKLLNLKNKPFDDVVSVQDGEMVMDITSHFETIEEGMDLTEYLGVKKYEKPLDPRLAGVARGNFPVFIRKTDQERVQNLFGKLKGQRGQYDAATGEVTYTGEYNFDQLTPWEATLKLDGSSCTFYFNEDYFGVCSRNLDLKETDDNTFWKVARALDLETHLRRIGKNIALQGELMGPGVQGNRESFNDHKFFLFDIWLIDEQRYMAPTERYAFMASEGLSHVEHAPILGRVSLGNFKTVEDFLTYVDVKSIHHHIAEGVVFKSQDGTNSFKAINNKFLLAEKD
jgi:RNA ligase (TIGR02306 family)